ncbi:DUF2785 domain-containing protein [Lysobacter sp. Root983]|uniref:DUF2785 domain-containing protein n=1 Tax=Lysobacter sp. Root983 TaxID=1736613 RepID=UPI0009E751D0|nr:DUF2785 domain-containing protein [Lysobacter sp. Root983]
MRAVACWLLLLAAPGYAAASPSFACPPQGWDRAALETLKREEFALADPVRLEALAQGLVFCLGDPDPTLRDGIAYEALSAWMRKGALPAPALRRLSDLLYFRLDGPEGEGYVHPFAALVLAEVARTDRVAAWMSAQERATMVARAVRYETSVRDYRGYDARNGWRHGVAHGADWLMQLSLNPALDEAQLAAIVDAVAAQAVPESGHAYVFGESERLAAPVLYAARRGFRDEAQWTAWFTALPARLGDAKQAYRDPAWLARRHDLLAFLQAIYVSADISDDARLRVLLPGATAALKAMH